jgi:hypothetical protein
LVGLAKVNKIKIYVVIARYAWVCVYKGVSKVFLYTIYLTNSAIRVTIMTNTTNAATTTTTYVLQGIKMSKCEYEFVTACLFGNNEIKTAYCEYVQHLVRVFNEGVHEFDTNTVFVFNNLCMINFYEDNKIDLCNELAMINVSKYMTEEILVTIEEGQDMQLVQDYINDGFISIAYSSHDLHGEPDLTDEQVFELETRIPF